MNKNRVICQCSNVTLGEVVNFIKKNDIQTLSQLVSEMEVGDKCESCKYKGFEEDGFSLSKAFSRVKSGEL